MQAERERDAAIAAARESDAEALRLHAADDRAITARILIAQLQDQLRDLSAGSVRQENLARILAEGAQRLKADNDRLVALRDEQVSLRHRLAVSESALETATAQAADLRSQRDRLSGRLEAALGDLDGAQQAIARYLARLETADLTAALGDDLEQVPMHELGGDRPLALAGRYGLTLRVTRQPPAPDGSGRIAVGVVLQRPGREAPPDITIMLYDETRRALRRVSLGFAGQDSAPSVLDGSAIVPSEAMPRFARIIITPPTGQQHARNP